MIKEQFINAHPNIKINNTMFLNEDGFRDFTEEELINLCSISFDNASKLFMYIYMYDYEKYYKKMRKYDKIKNKKGESVVSIHT